MSPRDVIERLMAAFEALDFASLYELVAEDVVYQNMPQGPIYGRAALKRLFEGFGNVSQIRFERRGMAVDGNRVLTEHLDHLVINGRTCVVPMMSSYTLRDGKVVEWREYYDMPTFERQLGRTHPGAAG
ncbi:MAG TPA: nuclear transport factor 2 family protein [Stellaceae bacterium]|nr:nuclear transport factor 2 family protein [Stellaceae bacterium]